MSVFQKAAILFVRTYAFVMLMYGVLGLGEEGFLLAYGSPDPYAAQRVVSGVVWVAVGAVGTLVASSLGRWLGRGLG